MVSRKLLIVHDSRVVRNLLKQYVRAELDDVTVFEASSGKQVEKTVLKEPIDIILCASFLRDCEAPELKNRLSETKDSQIPFITFTATGSEEHLDDLKSKGIEHFLVSPFSSAELRDKINTVFDPRKLRRQQRYSIPGTEAHIHFENRSISAEVINISQSSVLCEFSLPPKAVEVLQSIYISIRFPADLIEVPINDIYCKLLSIKTTGWLPNDSPEKVKVIWLFKNLSQSQEKRLMGVLDKVEETNRKVAGI